MLFNIQVIVKAPIKTVPDVSHVLDSNLVNLDPKQLISAMDKAICFVEVSMKPYSIGSLNGKDCLNKEK